MPYGNEDLTPAEKEALQRAADANKNGSSSKDTSKDKPKKN